MAKSYGTVGYSRSIPSSERRWKRVAPDSHLERRVTQYGVETRCRECRRKRPGYNVDHLRSCLIERLARARLFNLAMEAGFPEVPGESVP